MTLEVRFCPQCGTRRTGYFRFCGRCGFDFDDLRIGPVSEATAAPPRPEPTTPIWPPPAQWPPPDALTAPEVALPAEVVAPSTLVPPQPAVVAPQPQLPVDAPSVAVPPAPSVAPPPPVDWPAPEARPTPPPQAPAARPLLARSLTGLDPTAAPAVQPQPAAPAFPSRPAVTWTRIAIITLAGLLAANAIANAITPAAKSAPTPLPTVGLGSPLIVDSPSPASPAAVTPGPSFGLPPGTQFAVVTRVVDGDTIRVDINGTEFPVRYIGIDAPEPNAKDPAVKKLADAATRINATLVEGQEVFLERDVSETDRFDRLLRNVWLIDSGGSQVLVNLELVRLGFAKVTTFPPDEKYVGYLTTAEASAKAEQLGLWAPGSTPASTSSPAAAAASPNTLVAASDTGASNCHPSYTPCLPIVGDLDCGDIRVVGKDPVQVKGPDEYRLDADGDGLGCE